MKIKTVLACTIVSVGMLVGSASYAFAKGGIKTNAAVGDDISITNTSDLFGSTLITSTSDYAATSNDYSIQFKNIKTGSGSSRYSYIMFNSGNGFCYNTNVYTDYYVSKVSVTFTSGTSSTGKYLISFGTEALSTSVTATTTVSQGKTVSATNNDPAKQYFQFSTSTKNVQVSTLAFEFTAKVSTDPSLSPSQSALSINKGSSDSFVLTPSNCTPDHYGAVSSDTAVATVATSGSTITVSGIKDGTSIITASAYNASNTVLASIDVSAIVNAQSLKASPATTTLNTESTKNVALTSSYFNGTVTYSASSSDSTVATVAIADPAVGAAVITSTSKAGTATITYTATDGTDTVTATTAVTVEAASISLSQSTLNMGIINGPQDITVAPSKFNGDATYSTSFSTANIASAVVNGTTITVTPLTAGTTTMTVTGTYGTQTATATCAITTTNLVTGSNRLTISSTSANHNDNDIVATVTTAKELLTWTSPYFTMTQAKNSASSDVVNTYDEIRAYVSHSLTWTPATGVSITSIVANANSTSYATALSGSTFTNAATPSVSSKVVTITPTAQTTAVSVALTAQSRIDSIVVNYTYEASAAEVWAIEFLNNTTTVCTAGENNSTPSSDLLSAWNTSNTSYGELEADQQTALKNATVDTTNIGKAVARYDYILGKYGVSAFASKGGNFIDRSVAGSPSFFGREEKTDESGIIITVILSAFALIGTGLALYVRKRKED